MIADVNQDYGIVFHLRGSYDVRSQINKGKCYWVKVQKGTLSLIATNEVKQLALQLKEENVDHLIKDTINCNKARLPLETILKWRGRI